MIQTDVSQSLRRRLRRTPASPLLVFGFSAAFTIPAQAGDADALPRDPNIAAGGASFAQSGRNLTVNQTTDRVVIDWRSFDIGANAQTNFNQPSSRSIAVNRIGAGSDPTRIDGGLSANGQVWILNPNGVLFGGGARVNAAGIVASTANIDAGRFMAGDNRLLLTGRDSGAVVNDGRISVGESGLAAFVAPSVRNNGVITARAGKVTLAAGTTFTLDLAGDRLIEIGLGADKVMVDQSGKIVSPGGVVTLSAKAASAVVDGAINMSGVIRTVSARRAGGDIILDADTVTMSGTADASGNSGGVIAITAKTIDISDSALLHADGQGNGQGDGGTIIAVAAERASYAGQYSARGGAAGGNGGKIETSGEALSISPTIKVDASAPGGKAGEWLIDPLNVTISAGSGGALTGATVTTGAIQSALAGGTSVTITTAQGGADAGDLTLAGTINAAATGNAGLTLTGRRLLATGNSVVNIAGGALTLNVNAVNTSSTPSGSWINDALGVIGTVSGGSTINLGAGAYTLPTQLNINKRVSLVGAGIGSTILTSNSTSYGINVIADNVRLSGFTFNAPTATGSATYGIKVTPDTNVRSDRLLNFAIDHVRINGGYRTGLDIHGALGATIDTVSVANVVNGNGIALTDSSNVTITNSITSNDAWGGLALYQTNRFYDQKVDNISVNASNSFNDAIPVYAEDQSASLDMGTLALAGFGYVIKAPNLANDIYTWFQKTARAAVDFATNALLSNNNLTPATATVQGYGGNGVQGNNVFTVGIGSNGTAMSITVAVAAATAGGTINLMDGTYVIPGSTPYLNINKSLSLVGQSQAGTIIDAHAASQYGLRVTADNVSLSNFTLLGATAAGNSYGIKVENNTDPSPGARISNFSISNVTSRGARKAQLDLNGVVGAAIDRFTADGTSNGFGPGSQAGAGIAISDSANVTITNSSTRNNAYGGLALYQTNVSRNQQVTGITVAASNSFAESVPVYMEDTSASQNFGAVTIYGFNYVITDPSNAADLFTFFQKTRQAAVDYAVSRGAASYVQGWTGTAGNNVFAVGIGTGGTAMSIQTAMNAASSGAVLDIASGSYAGSLIQNIRATVSFGTVTLGGNYTLNSGAANSVLSGSLSAAAVNWNAPVNLGGALSLDTHATNGGITIAAINGGQALSLNAGTGAISLGSLGTTTRLGVVNSLSRTMLTGDAYYADRLNFAQDVILTAAQTILDTSAAGDDIIVGGTLRGSFEGAQSVTLRAGSGTGPAIQNGDLVLQNVGTSGLALGNMTVAGGNFSAQTVHLAGDFNSTLTGNQVFSSNTLNAGGVVQSAVGGDASGPINAGGAVGLSVSGQLSGTIGGSNIDLNAGTILDATVNATQGVTINADTVAGSTLNAQTVSATAANFSTNVNAASVTLDAGTITGSTITGSSGIAIKAKSVQGSSLAAPTVTATADSFNTIVAASSSARISGVNVAGTFTGGSFTVSGTNSVNANMSTNSASVSGGTIAGTYTGNAVSLAGSTSVNATVSSKTLSVQTPSGNLQGSWASVDTGQSGTLLLNQQANLGGDVRPSQLVVENFALPKRSAVTARGDILLPQNLSLGLLSPAGTATPAFIVVQSVQQLGTLLSQNYSAIVIDLGGTARREHSTD